MQQCGSVSCFGFGVVAVLLLVCYTSPCFGHGYVLTPPSRQAQCQQRIVSDCGPVMYEPQSVEGLKGRSSCSGDVATWAPLDDDSKAWVATPVASGIVQFKWVQPAVHPPASWEYYIGSTRIAFLHTADTIHCVDLTGYHGRTKLLAIWNIADTANAFYNCIDLDIGAASTGSGTCVGGGATTVTPPPTARPPPTVVSSTGGASSGSCTAASSYTVVSGDTLSAIAARKSVTLSALVAANPAITDPSLISIGQVIVIPSTCRVSSSTGIRRLSSSTGGSSSSRRSSSTGSSSSRRSSSTGTSATGQDTMRFTIAPATIATTANYGFDVTLAYSVTGHRTITVDLILADAPYTWYGKGLIAVAPGASTVRLRVTTSGTISSGTRYKLSAWMVDSTVYDVYRFQMTLPLASRDPALTHPWTSTLAQTEVGTVGAPTASGSESNEGAGGTVTEPVDESSSTGVSGEDEGEVDVEDNSADYQHDPGNDAGLSTNTGTDVSTTTGLEASGANGRHGSGSLGVVVLCMAAAAVFLTR